MARNQTESTNDNSEYIKQFTFHDEETGKDIEALYNPKEKDALKAWKRHEIQCRCKK